MSIRIIVGVNWGDEGKGRMVDYFADDADFVIRFQGGSNAGHTVINKFGKFKLHLMPSGIFSRRSINILGPGTVINLEILVNELQQLRSKGVQISENNYKISNRAFLCFPFHLLQDVYEEERLGKKEFGSTRQGIAPTYGDKYTKYGIQVGSLLYPNYLRQQIKRCLELKNAIFKYIYKKPIIDTDEMFNWAMKYGTKIHDYICDTSAFFKDTQLKGKNMLFEGQLGSLRDIHYGIYPYTTSSCTLSSFAPIGSGIQFRELPIVTGIMKAFSTCVGTGPFVTEMHGNSAETLREIAYEYGASTGRPRRIGYFDGVASKYGVQMQSATELVLTKLDCLSGQRNLKICTHYKIGSRIIDYFPLTAELANAKPAYIKLPGWAEDISGVRTFSKLPKNAQEYIKTIEKIVDCPIKYISVGAERNAIIVV